MQTFNRSSNIDFSSWTAAAIKDYLTSADRLRPEEIAALCNDGRKSVQEQIFAYLRQRANRHRAAELLHKMAAKEEALRKQGYIFVAGVDEAGRGPLAGPVVAAAVILGAAGDYRWQGINDSKQLSPVKRDQYYKVIIQQARAWAVGIVDAATVDRLNIYRASLEAMRLAVTKLHPQPRFVISDGFTIPDLDLPQEAVPGGDAVCLSIAAASIIAKVTRDRLMQAYEKTYPGYGFARHKGYPTPEHKKALQILGPTPIHRRTFKCF
ncbi:MAG: ribonuclease HII [Firmicutes bacterium]|nr:ribonuclease HII [Bacillota bacterium]